MHHLVGIRNCSQQTDVIANKELKHLGALLVPLGTDFHTSFRKDRGTLQVLEAVPPRTIMDAGCFEVLRYFAFSGTSWPGLAEKLVL